MGPNYLNEVFQWAAESNRTLRNDYLKLKHPFRKTTAGQNSLCFLGPSKWNKLQKSVITLILSNIKKALSGTTCKLRKFIIATIIGSNNIFFFFLYFWKLLYLRDHNENKAFCLFCVTPAKKTQFLFIYIYIFFNHF